jgi:hypothetical protein
MYSWEYVQSIPTCPKFDLQKAFGKVKVKFTLEEAMKVQRGSRGIALLFL